jgi:hypothetical protein
MTIICTCSPRSVLIVMASHQHFIWAQGRVQSTGFIPHPFAKTGRKDGPTVLD